MVWVNWCWIESSPSLIPMVSRSQNLSSLLSRLSWTGAVWILRMWVEVKIRFVVVVSVGSPVGPDSTHPTLVQWALIFLS